MLFKINDKRDMNTLIIGIMNSKNNIIKIANPVDIMLLKGYLKLKKWAILYLHNVFNIGATMNATVEVRKSM